MARLVGEASLREVPIRHDKGPREALSDGPEAVVEGARGKAQPGLPGVRGGAGCCACCCRVAAAAAPRGDGLEAEQRPRAEAAAAACSCGRGAGGRRRVHKRAGAELGREERAERAEPRRLVHQQPRGGHRLSELPHFLLLLRLRAAHVQRRRVPEAPRRRRFAAAAAAAAVVLQQP